MGSYGLMLLPASSAIISTARRFLDRNDPSYTRRRSSNKKHHTRVSCSSGDQDQVVVVVDHRGSTGSSSAAAGATKIQQISGELYKCDKDAKTCHPLDAGVARYELLSHRERAYKFHKTIQRLKKKQHTAAVDDTRRLLFEPWQQDGHSMPSFGSFHRLYLLLFEERLQKATNDKSIAVSYWDSTLDQSLPSPCVESQLFADIVSAGDVTRGGRLEGVPRLRLAWLNMADELERFSVAAEELERFSMAAELESPYDPTFMMSLLFVDHLIHSFRRAEGLNTAAELESPFGNGVDFTGDPILPFGKVEGFNIAPKLVPPFGTVDLHLPFGNDVDFTGDAIFPFHVDDKLGLIRFRVRDVLDALGVRYTYKPVGITGLRSGKRLQTIPAPACPCDYLIRLT